MLWWWAQFIFALCIAGLIIYFVHRLFCLRQRIYRLLRKRKRKKDEKNIK